LAAALSVVRGFVNGAVCCLLPALCAVCALRCVPCLCLIDVSAGKVFAKLERCGVQGLRSGRAEGISEGWRRIMGRAGWEWI
jgi:hypothetical protein